MTEKVRLTNSRPFYTKRVRIILELSVPDTQKFNEQLYKDTWLRSLDFLRKGLISTPELIQIGSILQTRNLPSAGLKAYTNPVLSELFEYCNEIVYKFGMKLISLKEINDERTTLEKYAEGLM
jgi:hypothetical protein